MTYFCAIILLAVITYQWIQLTAQQQTIRDLNDRLMARSYAEYSAGKARDDPPPEMQTRSPKSWYDDPNILDGDDE